MATYRNKKNGKIATLVEEDKKYKTVLLEFEDGTEKQVSTSTLKRWWELVDEDEDEEYDEDDEDLDDDEDEDDEDDEDSEEEDDEDSDDEDDEEDEDDESDDDEDDEEDDEDEEDDDEDDEEDDEDEESDDDDDVEEDEDEEDEEEDEEDDDEEEEEEEEEKPAPKKSKSKKTPAPRKKAEDSPVVTEMVTFVEGVVEEQDGEIFTPQSQPRNRAFKVGGHMYARLLYSTKAITVACRKDAVKSLGIKPTKTINHMFSELYTYDKLDKTGKANIKKLLKASFDYQLKKNTASEKPKKAAKTKEAEKSTKKGSKKKEK